MSASNPGLILMLLVVAWGTSLHWGFDVKFVKWWANNATKILTYDQYRAPETKTDSLYSGD